MRIRGLSREYSNSWFTKFWFLQSKITVIHLNQWQRCMCISVVFIFINDKDKNFFNREDGKEKNILSMKVKNNVASNVVNDRTYQKKSSRTKWTCSPRYIKRILTHIHWIAEERKKCVFVSVVPLRTPIAKHPFRKYTRTSGYS